VNAHGVWRQRFDGSVQVIKQCKTVACIQARADEFAIEMFKQCDSFFNALVFVIFNRQPHPVLLQNWSRPFKHLAASLLELTEFN